VCDERLAPRGAAAERGFACLEVAGPIPFAEVGVLAGLAGALATAGVSVFALSTHDTDYLLVRDADLERASSALAAAGHPVDAAG
jgi:hypothetical protein